MKQFFLMIILISILLNFGYFKAMTNQESDHTTIIFFIREYPTISNNETPQLRHQGQELICKNYEPPYPGAKCETFDYPFTYGIFSTYGGNLAITDINGQTTFPRRTQKNAVDLLITDKIAPIFSIKNTIAYWEIDEDAKGAKFYSVDRKHDEETNLYYWDVREKDIPQDRRIGLHTITIFADPESIYVPVGITPTTDNPQLVLPNIYAKRNFDASYVNTTLFVLTIKQFFSQIRKIYKEFPLGYQILITT